MLCTILPEETALVSETIHLYLNMHLCNEIVLSVVKVLWYNKSRARSRVCPACQRLYRLGDVLPGHIEEEPRKDRPLPPQLLKEQEISGLCIFLLILFFIVG